MIRVKRVYERPQKEDGFRILVDRLWPRGLTKSKSKVDLWLRDVAPSDNLRRWFSHDPDKWETFQKKYGEELRGKGVMLDQIRGIETKRGIVTLLFSAKEVRYNNAVALNEYLKK